MMTTEAATIAALERRPLPGSELGKELVRLTRRTGHTPAVERMVAAGRIRKAGPDAAPVYSLGPR